MPYVRKETLNRLVSAGRTLSNVAHNWKQNRSRFEEHERNMLEELQVEWDRATEQLREEAKRGK